MKPIITRRATCLGTILTPALLTSALTSAVTAGTQTWNFNQSTTGNPISWISPTSVDPAADAYEYLSILSSVKVDVKWGVFTFTNIDVTNQIDPAFLVNEGSVPGPAPIEIFSGAIVYPEPPAVPGIAATLETSLNRRGFGELNVTDIALGTTSINLGPPFGTQTVTILKVAIAGSIQVTPITLATPGDLNGDDVVDGADLGLLLSSWGTNDAAADLDGSGTVDGADLGLLLSAWTG